VMRGELLRLCGARAAPHDRLWARWSEAFAEVRRLSGALLAPPWADGCLRQTHRVLMALRRQVRAFVAGEREKALSPEVLRRLDLPAIESIHRTVLAIAEGCRPVVEPQQVVNDALSALGVLSGRREAARRVEVLVRCEEAAYLANAPGRLVSLSLERLLDNALRLSPPQAPVTVVVETAHDEIIGDEVLVFSVLDTLATIPAPETYGTGLRGVRDELAAYECGVAFARLAGGGKPPFIKEARITVPIMRCAPLPAPRRAALPLAASLASLAGVMWLVLLATSRLLGGAPIQFAGGGDPVVEFRVEVGETLTIPLCEGGRHPQAWVSLRHDSCRPDRCSLAPAISALAPCAERLASAACPGELVWTPDFVDGSRQGTSYELTMRCVSLGPPVSEDSKRVRVVVFRPNSSPRFVLMQIRQGEQIHVLSPERQEVVEIRAGGALSLQAFAKDDDDDPLLFQLLLPDGRRMESYDGRFILPDVDWDDTGGWEATLSVSDQVSEAVSQVIRLQAGKLRPMRLEELVLEGEQGDHLPCVGPSDARLCEIVDGQTYTATLSVWFDPLLGRVDERLNFSTTEESAVVVVGRREHGLRGESPTLGDAWDVRARFSERTLASITLIDLPADNAAGERLFRFQIDVAKLALNDPQHWTLKLSVAETSERSDALNVLLVLARSELGKQPTIEFSTRQVRLTEYVGESERAAGRASVQVFLFGEAASKALAEPVLVCENRALAEAFERPRLRQGGDGEWSLLVALKPGCIEGLGGAGSALGSLTSRSCRVDIATQDGQERGVVRVVVEDRVCAPEIRNLAPAFDGVMREGETLVWTFEIVDADGDLDESGIAIRGSGEMDLVMRRDADSLGARFIGTLSARLWCPDLRRPIAIEARDRRGYVTREQLDVRMRCLPLVKTAAGSTSFEVDEGELLEVELVADEGVRIVKREGVGSVVGSRLVWRATCERGRGPHRVEIRGEHEESYGEPLALEVRLRRCQPRLALEERGKALDLQRPLLMEAYTVRRLRVVPSRARPQDLEFSLSLEPESMNLTVSPLTGQPDFWDLRCRQPGERKVLTLSAVPVEEMQQDYLSPQPLRLDVVCVGRGEVPRENGAEWETP